MRYIILIFALCACSASREATKTTNVVESTTINENELTNVLNKSDLNVASNDSIVIRIKELKFKEGIAKDVEILKVKKQIQNERTEKKEVKKRQGKTENEIKTEVKQHTITDIDAGFKISPIFIIIIALYVVYKLRKK